jgi:hypothetical protein
MPAFRAFDFVSRLPIRRSGGANCRKSPAVSADIPILRRLSAETWFDHDCRRSTALDFAPSSTHAVIQLGGGDPRPWRTRPQSHTSGGALNLLNTLAIVAKNPSEGIGKALPPAAATAVLTASGVSVTYWILSVI